VYGWITANHLAQVFHTRLDHFHLYFHTQLLSMFTFKTLGSQGVPAYGTLDLGGASTQVHLSLPLEVSNVYLIRD
jgi:hypothetical protein